MKYTLAGLLLFTAFCSNAQKPYWQQQVDNRITVTLDDKEHVLRGHISIDYYNHSPDTLKFIYFHLYPNAYKTDRTAFEKQMVENGKTDHYFAAQRNRGYIDSLSFMAVPDSGEELAAGVVATKDDDIVRLILPEPLAPGAHVKLETPFKVKIPQVFSRMGHSGQSYQISQWFPKPAVYDKNGWHPIPYLDQGEFYSEFGNYHVEITLPENYIIMGTGNILDEKENAWLDGLSKLDVPQPKKFIPGKGAKPGAKDTLGIPSSSVLKTVTFEEKNIHDFAWFADKKWVVRKDTVAVPGSDNVVTAYTCYYPKDAGTWAQSMEAIKTSIRGYSSRVGLYPYKTVKAVDGELSAGGGMEYPTITVIAPFDKKIDVRTAIIHEVGHNWFYGMLGTSERSYPWMDEGINSFYEHKYAPDPSIFKKLNKTDNFLMYSIKSATHDLVPADTSAPVMPEANYGADIYGKAPFLLEWLEAYVGRDTFEMAMKDYFAQWQYKHPQPEDFRKIIEQHSHQNLDWFFNTAMKSTKPVDYNVTALSQHDKTEITIKNVGGMEAPVKYNLTGRNATGEKVSFSAWTKPFTGKQTFEVPDAPQDVKWKDATIDTIIPDYNIPNNGLHSKLSLKPFMGFNLSEKHKVWISPAIGYNYYDGFMLGGLIHNLTLPQNKFQFAAVPMYAFGSKTFAGTGFMTYTKYYDAGWLHDIQFVTSAKTFSNNKTDINIDHNLYSRFIKLSEEVILNIRKPEWRSSIERNFSFKFYYISEGQFNFTQNPADSLYYPSKGKAENNFYGRVQYNYNNARTFNPFSYRFEGQIGKSFAKLSAEANLKVDYFQKNKALYIRGYVGKFFNLASNDFDSYRYRLASTYTGENDYLYDETYFGRNEQTGLWSQQISMKEGGFKVNTLQYASQLGLSDDWLFAVNLKTDIPYLKLPIRLFADFGTFANAKTQNPSGASVLYDAGVEIYISDYLNIYLPLILCKDFKDYTNSVYTDKKFARTISFSLNLGNINWGKVPPKILRMQ